MDDGHVVVDSIETMRLTDITYDLARESGFENVKELLQVRAARQRQQGLPDSVPLPASGWVGCAAFYRWSVDGPPVFDIDPRCPR